MDDQEERRAINEVRDRPTETYIKLLFWITAIAVALLAYMGDRFITNQDKQIDEMSDINANLKAYETRISRNEKDIQELESFWHNVKRKGEK